MNLSPVAGVADHRPRHPIDLLTAHPGPDLIDCRLLCPADDLVHLPHVRGRLADRDRAGRVRSVAEHQATDVQDHGVTAFDHPVTGLVVRIGAVGSGSDDGEIKLLVPESAQQPRQFGCDLAFTPTGERRLHDVLESEMRYPPAGSSSAPAT